MKAVETDIEKIKRFIKTEPKPILKLGSFIIGSFAENVIDRNILDNLTKEIMLVYEDVG